MRFSLLPACAAGLVVLSSMPVAAQTIEARPGLWARAHQTLLNGNKMPSILDIKGGLTPQDRQGIVAAMSKLGMPAGWAPGLECSTAKQFDAQALAQKAMAEGHCSVQVLGQSSNSAKFKMKCTPSPGSTLEGVGEVKVTGGVETEMKFSMAGGGDGMALRYEHTSISKWVGPDCNNPPPGIDARWLKL